MERHLFTAPLSEDSWDVPWNHSTIKFISSFEEKHFEEESFISSLFPSGFSQRNSWPSPPVYHSQSNSLDFSVVRSSSKKRNNNSTHQGNTVCAKLPTSTCIHTVYSVILLCSLDIFKKMYEHVVQCVDSPAQIAVVYFDNDPEQCVKNALHHRDNIDLDIQLGTMTRLLTSSL